MNDVRVRAGQILSVISASVDSSHHKSKIDLLNRSYLSNKRLKVVIESSGEGFYIDIGKNNCIWVQGSGKLSVTVDSSPFGVCYIPKDVLDTIKKDFITK